MTSNDAEAFDILQDAVGYLRASYRDDDDVDEAMEILTTIKDGIEESYRCRHCGIYNEYPGGYCSSNCYKADQL